MEGVEGVASAIDEDDASLFPFKEEVGVFQYDGRCHEVVGKHLGGVVHQLAERTETAYCQLGYDAFQQAFQSHLTERIGVYDGKFWKMLRV